MLYDILFVAVLLGFTVLTIYNWIVLYWTFDILTCAQCSEEPINPWACLIVNCIMMPYHCLLLAIWFYCFGDEILKRRDIIHVTVYYLSPVIVTFITYGGTSASCWDFINSNIQTQDLSFMITFYSRLHIVGLVVLVIFWRIVSKNIPGLQISRVPIVPTRDAFVAYATPVSSTSHVVPVQSVLSTSIILSDIDIIPG